MLTMLWSLANIVLHLWLFCSGRSQTHFVPIDCITAAVINEAVTPAGCYFYLAILMQGHHRMFLAFQVILYIVRFLLNNMFPPAYLQQTSMTASCDTNTDKCRIAPSPKTTTWCLQTLKPPLEILVRVRKAINNALVSGTKEKHV